MARTFVFSSDLRTGEWRISSLAPIKSQEPSRTGPWRRFGISFADAGKCGAARTAGPRYLMFILAYASPFPWARISSFARSAPSPWLQLALQCRLGPATARQFQLPASGNRRCVVFKSVNMDRELLTEY